MNNSRAQMRQDIVNDFAVLIRPFIKKPSLGFFTKSWLPTLRGLVHGGLTDALFSSHVRAGLAELIRKDSAETARSIIDDLYLDLMAHPEEVSQDASEPRGFVDYVVGLTETFVESAANSFRTAYQESMAGQRSPEEQAFAEFIDEVRKLFTRR